MNANGKTRFVLVYYTIFFISDVMFISILVSVTALVFHYIRSIILAEAGTIRVTLVLVS